MVRQNLGCVKYVSAIQEICRRAYGCLPDDLEGKLHDARQSAEEDYECAGDCQTAAALKDIMEQILRLAQSA